MEPSSTAVDLIARSAYEMTFASLYVVDAGCAKGELPVSWSKSAIQGSQGQQGDQGPQGDTGPQGTAGLTFAQGQFDYVVSDSVIGGLFKELTCPAGTKALDGAWDWCVLNGSKGMDEPVSESFPIGDDSWAFVADADSNYNSQPMNVYLRCVHAS